MLQYDQSGGVATTASPLQKAEALESVLRISGVENIKVWNRGFTDKQACELQNRWVDKLPEFVFAINEERLIGTGITHYALSSNSFDNFLEQFQDANPALIVASYIVMVLYAAFSLSATPCGGAESRIGVGLAGICIVGLAVASSFGLAGLLDIPFNPTSTQVLPFLALGLGVDDMFVLAHHFKAYGSSAVDPAEMVRLCLVRLSTMFDRFSPVFRLFFD